MSAIARLIDANANRAREAMRVLEDGARFFLNDAALTRRLKELRHDFRNALDQLPDGWLEANRDVSGDVGTRLSTQREMQREDFADLVVAAGKRLTEAMRAIEEASKTINPVIAADIESLRYRAYAIEADLHAKFGCRKVKQWALCLLLTQSLCKKPWQEVLADAMAGGIDCVQVREKEMHGGELAAHVRQVIAMARPQGVSVIVNDRADVAVATGADGVHLGTGDLAIADARRLAGRTLIIGASTHSLDEANDAITSGADYCGVGAMFDSSLKPMRQPAGVGYVREFLARYPNVCHLAIGGITPENVSEVTAAGAKGIAVSTAICAADEPRAAAEQLCAAVTACAPPTSTELQSRRQ